MKSFILFLGFFVFASQGRAADEELSEFVTEAQAAMNAGRFDEASGFYESAIFSGHHNGHIYYNYGIALWRKQDLGASMAAFLAAQRYLPRDPDVKANLRYVHSQIEDAVSYDFPTPVWAKPFFWTHSTTRREQFLVAATLLFLMLSALAVRQYWTRFTAFSYAAVVCGVLSAVFWAGLAVDFKIKPPVGAVQAERIRAYSGPSTHGNSVVFEVSKGSPVLLLDKEENWVKITLSDGQKGWVERTALAVF